MCPCNPNSTTINVPPSPGIQIPGFPTLPASPVQIPHTGFTIPNIESLLDLVQEFSVLLPSSTLKPNLDDGVNTILSALTNLLDQMAPFMALYNFFQPLLNIIPCIIEVICSLLNPFKLWRAVRRLFKNCVGQFLRLFPFIALFVMILSILLLILALVEYIIAMTEKLIEDLLANIATLEKGLSLQDDDAVSATARKIAQLLCLMENLFSVLIAIGAIIAIIKALASLGGKSICGGGGAPSSGDESCCSSDICPPFIVDNYSDEITSTISGKLGELVYYNRINTDIRGIFGSLSDQQASSFNLPPQRVESWQFFNQELNQAYPFRDIITDVTGGTNIYFPEGVTYNKNTTPSKAPYTLDLTFNDFDAKIFIPTEQHFGKDYIIKNVIITEKPYIGVIDFDNNLNTNINSQGTFSLSGGLVYIINPDNSQTPYYVNNQQATIETFIHHNPINGYLPTIDDGYIIGDVNFALHVNCEVLLNYGLITVGCINAVANERIVTNLSLESVGFDPISVKLPLLSSGKDFLPDPIAAQQCTATSIAKLRTSVSPATVATFQSEIEACLNQLKTDTSEAYYNILNAGVSAFESKISIDTDIQFVTRTIKASVQLLDANGSVISNNIPTDIAAKVAGSLTGVVTLGQISDFTYDGYSLFNAEISSPMSGSGALTVQYAQNVFKNILNLTDVNTPSVIVDNNLPYQFISFISNDTTVRRDESDVALSGSE